MSNPQTRRMPLFDERPVNAGGTVFILGAGTSVDAGAPMANGFFRAFEKDGRSGVAVTSTLHDKRLKSIVDLRNKLLEERGDPRREINIEELFGITVELDKKAGRGSSLRTDLLYFITQVLQNSLMFYLMNNIHHEKPGNIYLAFVDKIIRNHDRSVIVTMNYDTIIEFACAHRKLCNIDHGIGARQPILSSLILAYGWIATSFFLISRLHQLA